MSDARYDIRAMSLAEILDTSFQLMRDRFWLMVGLSAVVNMPAVAFLGIFTWVMDPMALQVESIEDIGAIFVLSFGLYVLVTLAGTPFVWAAITAAARDAYLGRRGHFAEAARAGLARYLPLLVTYLVYMMVVFAAVVVGVGVSAAIVGLMSAGGDGGAAVGLARFTGALILFAGWMALAVIAGLMGYLLPLVVVIEKSSAFVALARTWELLDGMRIRALGVWLCAYLIVAVPSGGLQMLIAFFPVSGTLLLGAAQSVGLCFLVASSVVLYFDIRCRKEAFDLEHLAQQVEGRTHRPAPIG